MTYFPHTCHWLYYNVTFLLLLLIMPFIENGFVKKKTQQKKQAAI